MQIYLQTLNLVQRKFPPFELLTCHAPLGGGGGSQNCVQHSLAKFRFFFFGNEHCHSTPQLLSAKIHCGGLTCKVLVSAMQLSFVTNAQLSLQIFGCSTQSVVIDCCHIKARLHQQFTLICHGGVDFALCMPCHHLLNNILRCTQCMLHNAAFFFVLVQYL